MRASLGRGITVAVTTAIGLVVLAGFFVRSTFLRGAQSRLLDWAMILATVALLLGVLNILRTHVAAIWHRRQSWPYSIVLVVALVTVVVLGVVGQPAGTAAPSVQWVFRNVQAPLQATFFALLAFFVASAAYRALKVRSWPSLILVVVALIVLIGQIPLSASLWSALPKVKEWILAVPSTAGARGILIGAGLGVVLTGLRVLLGIDRPHAR